MSSDRVDRVREDDPALGMVVLDRDVRAPERARRWLEGRLDGQVSARRHEDAVLILSELVTNAVRHGLGAVVVRAAIDPAGGIQLSVTDSGAGTPEVQPPDPDRVGGVGLRIVAELSSRWGVASFPGGTTVWVVMDDTQG